MPECLWTAVVELSHRCLLHVFSAGAAAPLWDPPHICTLFFLAYPHLHRNHLLT